MRKQVLMNLFLLGIVIILGLVLFFAPGVETPKEIPKLTEVDSSKVQHIKIERPDQEPVELLKDAQGVWRINAPLHVEANKFRVDNLLQLLSSRTYKKLENTEIKLAELKLDPPLYKLHFDQLTISIGDKSPMEDGQRYLQLGQSIYLISDSIYPTISGEATVFVSLSPLGESPKIIELQLPDYHLVKNDIQWTLTTGKATDGLDTSADGLNTLIGHWQRLQAFGVRHHVDSPIDGHILVRLSEPDQPNGSRTVQFGIVSANKENFILALPDKGIQYQIPASQIDNLLRPPKKRDIPPAELGTPSTTTTKTIDNLENQAEDSASEIQDSENAPTD